MGKACKKERIRESEFWKIVEEMTALYGGWLGYLLRRQGEETLRIKADDITNAMKTCSVSVTSDGGYYVITLQEKGGDHEGE